MTGPGSQSLRKSPRPGQPPSEERRPVTLGSSLSHQHSPSRARETELGSQTLRNSQAPPGECPQRSHQSVEKRTRTVPESVEAWKARNLRGEDLAREREVPEIANTVVVENLSPKVGATVVRAGLSQFGSVVRVKKHVHPSGRRTGRVAVEMASKENAENVVYQATHGLLLLGSVPRPVHIRPATGSRDVPVTLPSHVKVKKTPPRIIKPGDNDITMFELRNIRYKHLMQLMRLNKAQARAGKKLHSEQAKQLERYLGMKDDLERRDPFLSRLIYLYKQDTSVGTSSFKDRSKCKEKVREDEDKLMKKTEKDQTRR